MQGKLTMGLIEQKEDEADREERQMRLLAISKEIDASQKLLDTKILIAEKTTAAPGSDIWGKISDLSNKVESLLGELEELRRPRERCANPIVAKVLEQASASMGVHDRKSSQLESDTED